MTPLVPADQDFYRVVAQTTGTLDFQVYFQLYDPTLLPAGGNLALEVLDAAGNVIAHTATTAVFGTVGTTANARIRIPAVQGQSYWLHVFGANADGTPNVLAVNGYNATIVNTAPPVPTDLELARSVISVSVTSPGSGYTSSPTVTITDSVGTPVTGAIATGQINNGGVESVTVTGGTGSGYVLPLVVHFAGGGGLNLVSATAVATITDTGDLPANTLNSDSGRSQFDNVTNVADPTIFLRLDDATFLQDIPGNQTMGGVPPMGAIVIPFNPSTVPADVAAAATPSIPLAAGYRVAVFDGGNGAPLSGAAHLLDPNDSTFIGFAQLVPGVPHLYELTIGSQGADSLADGLHHLTARVQIIDPQVGAAPATPANPVRQTGFGDRSVSLQITVDTIAPPVAFGTVGLPNSGLAAGSDSGVQSYPSTFTDNITNSTAPTFYGNAEANAVIRVYAQVSTATVDISTTHYIAATGGAAATALIVTTAVNNFSAGDQVLIAGVGVSGYDGTFTITKVDNATTFEYAITAVTPALADSSGGTATSAVAAGLAPTNYVLLGTTVAQPIDGTNACPIGAWTLTSTVDLNNPTYFAHDGLRHLFVTAEDLAGNVTDGRINGNSNEPRSTSSSTPRARRSPTSTSRACQRRATTSSATSRSTTRPSPRPW